LGLEKAGLDFTAKGIPVDECMRTNIKGIYAIGDVTGKSMLAHGASRMGQVAVDAILGIHSPIDFESIPWAIYSIPEAAGCGLDEASAREKGYEPEVHSSAYRANGRFLAECGFGSESSGGTAKIVSDKKSGAILGIHLLGPSASENIAAAAIVVGKKLTLEQMQEVIFPHPTFSETMHEAFSGLAD
jgi:dihydrolipoamide dehydrogenase